MSSFLANIAHNVMPEPVDKVSEYSVVISIGTLRLVSACFAALACLSATFAFSSVLLACEVPFTQFSFPGSIMNALCFSAAVKSSNVSNSFLLTIGFIVSSICPPPFG